MIADSLSPRERAGVRATAADSSHATECQHVFACCLNSRFAMRFSRVENPQCRFQSGDRRPAARGVALAAASGAFRDPLLRTSCVEVPPTSPRRVGSHAGSPPSPPPRAVLLCSPAPFPVLDLLKYLEPAPQLAHAFRKIKALPAPCRPPSKLNSFTSRSARSRYCASSSSIFAFNRVMFCSTRSLSI